MWSKFRTSSTKLKTAMIGTIHFFGGSIHHYELLESSSTKQNQSSIGRSGWAVEGDLHTKMYLPTQYYLLNSTTSITFSSLDKTYEEKDKKVKVKNTQNATFYPQPRSQPRPNWNEW